MMEDGVAYGVQFVLTAATPRNNRNPTFRIYYLDRNTLELIDWQNYQLDLNNITGKEVLVLYSCCQKYSHMKYLRDLRH